MELKSIQLSDLFGSRVNQYEQSTNNAYFTSEILAYKCPNTHWNQCDNWLRFDHRRWICFSILVLIATDILSESRQVCGRVVYHCLAKPESIETGVNRKFKFQTSVCHSRSRTNVHWFRVWFSQDFSLLYLIELWFLGHSSTKNIQVKFNKRTVFAWIDRRRTDIGFRRQTAASNNLLLRLERTTNNEKYSRWMANFSAI